MLEAERPLLSGSPGALAAASGVRSVERALDILWCVAERPGSTLGDVARHLGLSKSTAHRLLLTLEQRQVIEREADARRYRPGRRLRGLLATDHAQVSFRAVALAEMHSLRELSGETVTLHRLDGPFHVVVEQLESRHEIRRVHALGQPIPLLTGATAKALLAALPVGRAHAVLAANRTSEVSGPTEEELADIRQVGYALSTGERITGSCAISAAIRHPRNGVWGAISLAGPAFRFSPARGVLHAVALVKTAARLSESLTSGDLDVDAPRADDAPPASGPQAR